MLHKQKKKENKRVFMSSAAMIIKSGVAHIEQIEC
uniref:Uncharacterized protein n=1 Tax=Arundo donax TaxID=35708 RepID=A0A0A9B1E8_ARUDO